MFRSKIKIIIKFIYFNIFLLTFSFSQFKSDRQNSIESLILSPCCYGGIVSEHNSLISQLISDLIQKMIIKDINQTEIINNLKEIIDISIKNGFITLDENQDNFQNMIIPNMRDNDILDIFVYIYGEKIRAVPQNNIFGKLTWFFPFLLMILGIVAILNIIKNISKEKQLTLSNEESLILENKIKNYNKNLEK